MYQYHNQLIHQIKNDIYLKTQTVPLLYFRTYIRHIKTIINSQTLNEKYAFTTH